MKVYILVRGSESDRIAPAAYAMSTFKDARRYADKLKAGPVIEQVTIHELSFDPAAGYQTVNICQLNHDGSRQDEEYKRYEDSKIREMENQPSLF